MPDSYRKVDYRIRLEKHTERRMLVQLFQRISQVFPIESYQYIGFGSIYFADFILFHKVFGIDVMTSIEDTDDKRRFEFNKPYSFIKMVYEHSSRALPALSWSMPTILWLDYDSVLDSDVISDTRLFVQRAPSRSIFIATVNAEAEKSDGDWFLERVGEDISSLFAKRDLTRAKFPATCITSMTKVIDLALDIRNGTDPDPVSFRALASLEYQDGSRMATLVGILLNDEDSRRFEECKLEGLGFLNTKEPFRIFVPKLTPSERRAIDQLIPDIGIPRTRFLGVPQNDIERYLQVYRYAPLYAEVDI